MIRLSDHEKSDKPSRTAFETIPKQRSYDKTISVALASSSTRSEPIARTREDARTSLGNVRASLNSGRPRQKGILDGVESQGACFEPEAE